MKFFSIVFILCLLVSVFPFVRYRFPSNTKWVCSEVNKAANDQTKWKIKQQTTKTKQAEIQIIISVSANQCLSVCERKSASSVYCLVTWENCLRSSDELSKWERKVWDKMAITITWAEKYQNDLQENGKLCLRFVSSSDGERICLCFLFDSDLFAFTQFHWSHFSYCSFLSILVALSASTFCGKHQPNTAHKHRRHIISSIVLLFSPSDQYSQHQNKFFARRNHFIRTKIIKQKITEISEQSANEIHVSIESQFQLKFFHFRSFFKFCQQRKREHDKMFNEIGVKHAVRIKWQRNFRMNFSLCYWSHANEFWIEPIPFSGMEYFAYKIRTCRVKSEAKCSVFNFRVDYSMTCRKIRHTSVQTTERDSFFEREYACLLTFDNRLSHD